MKKRATSECVPSAAVVGSSATAVEALPLIAETTSRPIVVDSETAIGAGAIGGFVLRPSQIGRDAGWLVMRILDGEDASDIQVTTDNKLMPMFDWRQLQRWNINASELPSGSEIRFGRQPCGRTIVNKFWERVPQFSSKLC
jgi:ABC-type uncharacterized transport system substrate-binding protein